MVVGGGGGGGGQNECLRGKKRGKALSLCVLLIRARHRKGPSPHPHGLPGGYGGGREDVKKKEEMSTLLKVTSMENHHESPRSIGFFWELDNLPVSRPDTPMPRHRMGHDRLHSNISLQNTIPVQKPACSTPHLPWVGLVSSPPQKSSHTEAFLWGHLEEPRKAIY